METAVRGPLPLCTNGYPLVSCYLHTLLFFARPSWADSAENPRQTA